jgi:ribosomal protein L37AE/L43A
MLIIRGSYHFWPKRVAFRNDYCLRCQAPRRSIAIRTFDVGHLFWIPILPVGFWKRWQCEVCGQAPHAHPKVRRFFKWAGLVFSIAFSLLLWAAPGDANFGVLGWLLRVAAPAGGILLLFDLLHTPKGPSLRRELATIAPATDAVCPFCATPLLAGSGARWSCPQCGAVRY